MKIKQWIAVAVVAAVASMATSFHGPWWVGVATGAGSASPLARGPNIPSLRGVINVMDYGARGDGKTDDSAAIQRAFNAAKAAVTSGHSQPIVQFPPLSYHIAKAISVPKHVDIQGLGRADLVGNGNDAFEVETFRLNIRGLSFNNFGTCLHLPTSNVDSSMMDIEDCWFYQDCKLAIDTVSYDQSRSSILTVRNCFSNAQRFLKAYTDMLVIENCWISHDGGNHEVMVIDSRATISGSMFVPYAAIDEKLAPERCWIVFKASDFDRGLRVTGCRFSGEQGGGFTVLHNYAEGNSTYLAENGTQVCISFSDCVLDTLRSAPGRQSPVVLFAMPNAISIRDCSGTIARGLVSTAPQFKPPAPPKPGEMPRYSLEFDSASRRMTNQLREYGVAHPVADNLMPFVRGDGS